jgi:hypothetical protein
MYTQTQKDMDEHSCCSESFEKRKSRLDQPDPKINHLLTAQCCNLLPESTQRLVWINGRNSLSQSIETISSCLAPINVSRAKSDVQIGAQGFFEQVAPSRDIKEIAWFQSPAENGVAFAVQHLQGLRMKIGNDSLLISENVLITLPRRCTAACCQIRNQGVLHNRESFLTLNLESHLTNALTLMIDHHECPLKAFGGHLGSIWRVGG